MILILIIYGVNPPLAPPSLEEGPSQEERKKKKEYVEGESFLFALLSGEDIIPLFTNAIDLIH
ncbi:hypothetical protein [Okeania sp. KiyG1]|uniref:hypothetical protein n=1 Tax=Okeania sp. KiyG1 TaxID=2720165 RepID=UPI0019248111|nr:hypothetical protein [Okeania sp. KiyG1]